MKKHTLKCHSYRGQERACQHHSSFRTRRSQKQKGVTRWNCTAQVKSLLLRSTTRGRGARLPWCLFTVGGRWYFQQPSTAPAQGSVLTHEVVWGPTLKSQLICPRILSLTQTSARSRTTMFTRLDSEKQTNTQNTAMSIKEIFDILYTKRK